MEADTRRRLAWAAVLGTCLLLDGVAWSRRPDLLGGADHLFGDQGQSLAVAEGLASGALLYRDLQLPYGPLPSYLHGATAVLFGNHVTTYLALLAALSLAHIALVHALVRRHLGDGWAATLTTIGVAATALIPASLVGTRTEAPYIPLERCLLAAVALAWAPPGRRSTARGLTLGVLLGSMQLVKFGGAAFALVAILLADALTAGRGAPGGRRGPRLAAAVAPIIAGSLAVELVLLGALFALLPAPVALDAAWPAYQLDNYAAQFRPDLRWPSWVDARFFLGQQLAPMAGAVLTSVGLVWWRRGRREDGAADAAVALVIPFAFYVAAATIYFRHVFLFYQHAWCLIPGATLAVAQLAGRARWAALAPFLPGFALVLKVVFFNAPPTDLRVVSTRIGDLHLDSSTAARVERLRVLLADELPGSDRTLILPSGPGLYPALGLRPPARQVWFLDGFVRPHDEAHLRRALERVRLVVYVLREDDPGSPTFDAWLAGGPLPPGVAEALRRRLGHPTRIDSGCEVYRLRPGDG